MPTSTCVLVCDRSPAVRQTCQAVLDGLTGIEVHTADDPSRILAELNQRPYALAIVEMEASGLGLLGRIRGQFPDTDVIVLAENATVQSATQAMRLGAYDYLAKPTTNSELAISVNRWFEHFKWQQEKAHLSTLIRLLELGRTLTSNLEMDTLFAEILVQVDQAFAPDTVSLMLLEKDHQSFVIAAHRGLSRDLKPGTRVRAAGTIAGEVVAKREPLLLLGGLEGTPYAKKARGRGIASAMAVPLTFKKTILGVLNVSRRKGRPNYTEEDAQLLNVFASQIAVAVQNARFYESIRAERDRILSAQEEVRRELARDLHDGLIQHLGAMMISLEHARSLLGSEEVSLAAELDNLKSMARQAIRDARSLVFGLRPLILETKGLSAALNAYVEQLRATNPEITFHVTAPGLEGDLPIQTQRVVFAILQEAIQNARKHASARNVWITLQRGKKHLSAVVQDDGTGFDLEEIAATYDQRYSFGLLNMRERAELIDAELTIDSEPGKGTRVYLDVPILRSR
jgi:signal transduction histidine kinase